VREGPAPAAQALTLYPQQTLGKALGQSGVQQASQTHKSHAGVALSMSAVTEQLHTPSNLAEQNAVLSCAMHTAAVLFVYSRLSLQH
jgi:hypothetical protein